MKVVSSDQMRAIEIAAFENGTTSEILMQNAGHAIALAIDSRVNPTNKAQLVALIGPGNNGLDGLIVCSELCKTDSYITTIILLIGNYSINTEFQVPVIFALVAALIVSLMLMIGASFIVKFIPKQILHATARVMAFILAALATQFIIDGIKASFNI